MFSQCRATAVIHPGRFLDRAFDLRAFASHSQLPHLSGSPAAAPLGLSTRWRYSGWALLLLATSANLRFGELARRRNQIDLDACEVRVNTSTSERMTGR